MYFSPCLYRQLLSDINNFHKNSGIKNKLYLQVHFFFKPFVFFKSYSQPLPSELSRSKAPPLPVAKTAAVGEQGPAGRHEDVPLRSVDGRRLSRRPRCRRGRLLPGHRGRLRRGLARRERAEDQAGRRGGGRRFGRGTREVQREGGRVARTRRSRIR